MVAFVNFVIIIVISIIFINGWFNTLGFLSILMVDRNEFLENFAGSIAIVGVGRKWESNEAHLKVRVEAKLLALLQSLFKICPVCTFAVELAKIDPV